MSTKASFAVTRAWSEAFAFLPRAWGGAWLILALLWGLAVAVPHVMMLHPFGHPRFVHCAVTILGAVLKLVALGALYRLALFGKDAGKEGLGLGGVQFGKPELRLLGANIVIGLFVLLILLAIFVVFAIGFSMSGLGAGEPNTLLAVAAVVHRHSGIDWVFIVYIALTAIFFVFFALRFVLAHAATVAERRMVTLNALGLATGNVGKLFIGLAALAAPFIAAAMAAFHHLHPRFVLSPRPPAFDAGFHVHMAVHAVLTAAVVLLLLPLVAGFLSSAYRQIVKNRSN